MSKNKIVSIRMRCVKYACWAIFFILPIMAFSIIEKRMRSSLSVGWYEDVLQRVPADLPDIIFIGSSRVAAAVDIDSFVSGVGLAKGEVMSAVNMGRGYSTLIEHYLGLQVLAKASADRLAGSTVFIECPVGLPTSVSLDESWINLKYPELIVPLLDKSDLPAFWGSKTQLEAKLQVTVCYFLKKSTLWRRRKAWREWRLRSVRQLIKSVLAVSSQDEGRNKEDLAQKGGIKTDSQSVVEIRQQAVVWAKRKITNPVTIRSCDSLVIADLVRFVRNNGGDVVFYIMPMSSVMAEPYLDPVYQKNIQTFQKWAKTEGCKILDPVFLTNDNDFPDLWHLRRTRALEFSRLLANSWCDN